MASFASGLGAGINLGANVLNVYNSAKQSDKADKLEKLNDGANAAARDAYQGYVKQFEQQPDGATAGGGMSLGGAPAAAPATTATNQAPQSQGLGQSQSGMAGMGLAPATQPGQQAQQPQAKTSRAFDERNGILAGMSARRKFLMTNGAGPDVWGGEFAKETALREQLRAEPIKQAYEHYSATGDFGAYARKVYPLIDDGVSIKSAEQKMGVDGKPAGWMLTVAGEDGKERSVLVNEATQQRMLMMSASPEERVKYELQTALAKTKADEGIRQKQGEQEAVQGTERLKSKLQLGEIDARGKQERKTKGMVTGDKAVEIKKPVPLSEGQILVGPGKDGKYETKAEGRQRTLGSTAQPSAGNRVLDMRRKYSAQIRSNPDLAEQLRENFREVTGEEY